MVSGANVRTPVFSEASTPNFGTFKPADFKDFCPMAWLGKQAVKEMTVIAPIIRRA